ncbi:LINE-1 retrotransposable element ORF2 protein [Eumeta japonica]|uniref:LINE-1 retrotransposable element ORF2 protein n=1 Tax=Eumeta variegata TaxID=151549 RepID=A0A4C1SPG3_EUMVA|nr:LINE-1 retrotransposable element ORF2 protein [Eumeta japonica]
METRNEMLGNRKDNKQKIASISKKIQESIRKHRKEELSVLREQIEKIRGINKGLKQLIEYTQWIPNMKTKSEKNKNEQLTAKRLSIVKVATDFYKKLYTETDSTLSVEEEKEIYEEEIPCILKSEVIKAIQSQKSGKAFGDDKISSEILKQSSIEICRFVTSLFNEILVTEQIPTQRTKSTIILLHKKGDKNEINNYRPISLLSNLYKVFSKIILGRITKRLEESQPKEQAGFRADYSTIDHIHVVKQIIEKQNEYGQMYYMAFVDYNKAFDSLSHSYIWKTLEKQEVERKYIRIIKKIYRRTIATIQLEQQGEEFGIEKGVRQGDPLSPKLIIAVLEDIFRNLDWEHFGININGSNLNHLRFADDIVLFAEKPGTLQTTLQQLDGESKKAGLCMNLTKTKLMTNAVKENIVIGEENIEYVDEYIYLGQTISINDQYSKEIDKRISNTWKRYWPFTLKR